MKGPWSPMTILLIGLPKAHLKQRLAWVISPQTDPVLVPSPSVYLE